MSAARMGRPTKPASALARTKDGRGRLSSLALPLALLRWISAEAAKQGRSRNEEVVRMLEEARAERGRGEK